MPSIETQESMLHRVEQVQLALYVHPVLDKRENKFFFFKQESSTALFKNKSKRTDHYMHK